MKPRHLRNVWKPLIRVLFGIFVLALILATTRIESVLAALSQAQQHLIVLGLALNLLTRLFAAGRNYAIGRGVGLPLSPLQTIEAMFIANFWSLVLPGVSAGSIATVHRYSRYGAPIGGSVGVLAASRAIELAVFCAVGMVALACSSQSFSTRNVVVLCAIPAAALAALVFGRRLAIQMRNSPARQKFRSPFMARARDAAVRVIAAFGGVPRKFLIHAAGFALAQCCLDAASALSFAWSLGLKIGWLDALWINMLTYLAILLPISVVGLGVREASIIVALAPLGISREAAIALAALMLAATLLNALCGGVLQLVGNPTAGRQNRNQDNSAVPSPGEAGGGPGTGSSHSFRMS